MIRSFQRFLPLKQAGSETEATGRTGKTLTSHMCSVGVGLAALVFTSKAKDSELETAGH